MSDKPNILKRILLLLPFYRHKAAERTYKTEAEYHETIDMCNRVLSRKIAPQVLQLVERDKIDTSVFENVEYFKKLIAQLFGKKSDIFASQLKIERVLHSIPGISIRILLMPSEGEVGQSAMVAFVYGDKNRYAAYSLEYSIGKQLAVCEWVEEKHFNYGFVADKKTFVKKVFELYKIEETDPPNFSQIDLKHRLADEIGVRYEKLDFYMHKFQNMVYDEMAGIDTSGIPADIDDVDEWMRYINWEMKQSMSRMSDKELEQSRALFKMMIERNRRSLN